MHAYRSTSYADRDEPQNSLFSASDAGAQGYATLLTLAFSAQAQALDPVA
jgi:hypothetical protein